MTTLQIASMLLIRSMSQLSKKDILQTGRWITWQPSGDGGGGVGLDGGGGVGLEGGGGVVVIGGNSGKF